MKLQLIVNNTSELSYDQVCSKILSHEIVLDCMNNNGISEDFPLFENKLLYFKNLQDQLETKAFNQKNFECSEDLNKILNYFCNKPYAVVDRLEISESQNHIDGELIRFEAGWAGNEENILPTNFFIAKGTKNGKSGCYSSLTPIQVEIIRLLIESMISSEAISEDISKDIVIDKTSLFLNKQSQNKAIYDKDMGIIDNVIELRTSHTYNKVIPEVG